MQRHIRLIANYPAVMPRSDVENIARLHLDDISVVHRGGGAPRDHNSHMFDRTALRSHRWTHMDRPLPAGFVSGPPNRHAVDPHQLKRSFFKGADLVWLLEALQDDVIHGNSPGLFSC